MTLVFTYEKKRKPRTIEGSVRMKAAILGAGAMGTTLGAHLARKGVPIDLIDPYEAHVEALNQEWGQGDRLR